MDDLSAIISKVLSDPESMRNLQQAAASLGFSTGEGQSGQAFSVPPPSPPQQGTQGSSRQQPLNWTMGGSGSSGNGRGSSSRRQRQQPEPPPVRDSGDMTYIKNMLEQLVENTRQPPPAAASQPAPAQSQGQQGSGLDLSALSGILEGLGGGQASGPVSPAGGDNAGLDLSALSGILGGLAGGGQASGQTTPPGGGASGIDLSALSGLLGGLGGGPSSGGGPDLGALSGLLGGLTGSGGQQPASPASGISALTAMLGGNESSPGGGSGSGPLGMNMNTLLKFQQAMSSISANAGNVRLMMALKGQLKDPDRIGKVDDAVKVMQVIQFLPILKESGIFGKFDEILDGLKLGNLLGGGQPGAGGLGGILSGLTGSRSAGGVSSLLGSLTGRR